MYGENNPFGSPDDQARKQQDVPDYGREYEGRIPPPSEEDEQAAIDREWGQAPEDAAEVAEYLRAMQDRMRAAGEEPKATQPEPDNKE